jgi:hypothetical protein
MSPALLAGALLTDSRPSFDQMLLLCAGDPCAADMPSALSTPTGTVLKAEPPLLNPVLASEWLGSSHETRLVVLPAAVPAGEPHGTSKLLLLLLLPLLLAVLGLAC